MENRGNRSRQKQKRRKLERLRPARSTRATAKTIHWGSFSDRSDSMSASTGSEDHESRLDKVVSSAVDIKPGRSEPSRIGGSADADARAVTEEADPVVGGQADVAPVVPATSGPSSKKLKDKKKPGLVLSEVKAEKELPSWKVEDYLKDEAWFRDVIGLPGIGVVPGTFNVSDQEMEKFYGPKQPSGYPFSAKRTEWQCQLNDTQRSEILELLVCTDGLFKVTNDLLLVGFARGYYAMRGERRRVNWAKFAHLKHKGQLDLQYRQGKPTPSDDTGIRDPSRKYTLPPDLAFLAFPPEENVQVKMQEDSIPAPVAVAPLPQMVTTKSVYVTLRTPDSKLSGNLLSGSSVSYLQPAGGSRVHAEHFKIFEDYLVQVRGQMATVQGKLTCETQVLERARLMVRDAEKGMEEAKRSIEKNSSTLLQDRASKTEKLKERDTLIARKEKLGLDIDVLEDRIVEIGESEPSFVEEFQQDLDRLTEEQLEVDREIESCKLKSDEIDGRIEELAASIASARKQSEELRKTELESRRSIPQHEDLLTSLNAKLNALKSVEVQYMDFQSVVTKLEGQTSAPSMVPSPSKNWSTFFRMTNCPICELAFTCCNFLPVSCGHAYHPACGLPFFMSQKEPRCKACSEVIHVSWLRTWGIPAGQANLDMALSIGLDEHEDALRKKDLALRGDLDTFSELQATNAIARKKTTRVYSKVVTEQEGALNACNLNVLRDGYNFRKMGCRVHGPKKEKGALVEVLDVSNSEADGGTERAVVDDEADSPYPRGRSTMATRSSGVQTKRPHLRGGRSGAGSKRAKRDSGGTTSTLARDHTPEPVGGTQFKPLKQIQTPVPTEQVVVPVQGNKKSQRNLDGHY